MDKKDAYKAEALASGALAVLGGNEMPCEAGCEGLGGGQRPLTMAMADGLTYLALQHLKAALGLLRVICEGVDDEPFLPFSFIRPRDQ
jgi:hypothetical protein